MSEDYRAFTYTIPAGETRRVDAVGSYLAVLDATATTLSVNINDSGFQPIEQGLTVELAEGKTFKSVQLKNTGAAAVTVQVAVGTGRLRDARFSFVGGTLPTEENVPAGGTSFGMTVSAGTTNQSGNDTSNTSYHVSNPPWSMGPVNVGVDFYKRGAWLCPGQQMEVKNTTNLMVQNPWSESIKLQVSVMRRT